MAVLLVFFLGIANIALHKAVLESRHPVLAQIPWLYQLLGGRFSLLIEFGMLLGAMLMIDAGSIAWAWGYGLYSLVNGLSAWLLLSGRI